MRLRCKTDMPPPTPSLEIRQHAQHLSATKRPNAARTRLSSTLGSCSTIAHRIDSRVSHCHMSSGRIRPDPANLGNMWLNSTNLCKAFTPKLLRTLRPLRTVLVDIRRPEFRRRAGAKSSWPSPATVVGFLAHRILWPCIERQRGDDGREVTPLQPHPFRRKASMTRRTGVRMSSKFLAQAPTP